MSVTQTASAMLRHEEGRKNREMRERMFLRTIREERDREERQRKDVRDREERQRNERNETIRRISELEKTAQKQQPSPKPQEQQQPRTVSHQGAPAQEQQLQQRMQYRKSDDEVVAELMDQARRQGINVGDTYKNGKLSDDALLFKQRLSSARDGGKIKTAPAYEQVIRMYDYTPEHALSLIPKEKDEPKRIDPLSNEYNIGAYREKIDAVNQAWRNSKPANEQPQQQQGRVLPRKSAETARQATTHLNLPPELKPPERIDSPNNWTQKGDTQYRWQPQTQQWVATGKYDPMKKQWVDENRYDTVSEFNWDTGRYEDPRFDEDVKQPAARKASSAPTHGRNTDETPKGTETSTPMQRNIELQANMARPEKPVRDMPLTGDLRPQKIIPPSPFENKPRKGTFVFDRFGRGKMIFDDAPERKPEAPKSSMAMMQFAPGPAQQVTAPMQLTPTTADMIVAKLDETNPTFDAIARKNAEGQLGQSGPFGQGYAAPAAQVAPAAQAAPVALPPPAPASQPLPERSPIRTGQTRAGRHEALRMKYRNEPWLRVAPVAMAAPAAPVAPQFTPPPSRVDVGEISPQEFRAATNGDIPMRWSGMQKPHQTLRFVGQSTVTDEKGNQMRLPEGYQVAANPRFVPNERYAKLKLPQEWRPREPEFKLQTYVAPGEMELELDDVRRRRQQAVNNGLKLSF